MALELLEGIRHFKNHLSENDKDLYASLSQVQSPNVLFITCSDSRIVPHQITHSDPGKLFVVRNIGNIVPEYLDTAHPSEVAAAVEFPLSTIDHITDAIVCGHGDCGAMKGLLTPNLKEELPHTAAWISPSRILVKDVEKRHPDSAKDFATKLKHLTQDNVLLQIENLKTHPAVTKRLAEGTLKIQGWYYEIETGEVHIYNHSKKAFIPYEQTVEEVATEKLTELVELEAINYLMGLSKPKSIEEHAALVAIYNKVRFTGVCAIWDQIATAIKTQLQQLVGKLYATADGGLSPSFTELMNKGQTIHLSNLEKIKTAITESPFYGSTPHRGNRLRNQLGTVFKATPEQEAFDDDSIRREKKEQLRLVLKNYLQQRELATDSTGEIKQYFYGGFFSLFNNPVFTLSHSYAEKKESVVNLNAALNGQVVDLDVPALSQGTLGKRLKAFIEAGHANVLVGTAVTTVNDFLKTLQDINVHNAQLNGSHRVT